MLRNYPRMIHEWKLFMKNSWPFVDINVKTYPLKIYSSLFSIPRSEALPTENENIYDTFVTIHGH